MSRPPPPVRVLVRVRPRDTSASTHEGSSAGDGGDDDILKTQIDANASAPLLCLRSKDALSWQGFKFDAVLDERATQADLMSHFDDIIDGVLRGVSSTAFAYGQTASGKTFSLIGKGFDDIFRTKKPWSQARAGVYSKQESWGIIPRSIHELFARLECDDNSVVSFTVRCSFMQIYNDKVFDLLAPRKLSEAGLPIREDGAALGGVTIHGLTSVGVSSAEQAIKLLYQGGHRRTVRETACNERSSRSHAIFSLSVETCSMNSNGTSITRRSLLNLVDCAGSERWGSDERSKLSATELTSINTSLSALGNCISALARKAKHIPFRSSALTRILKDCLGGGARAIIIATVHSSPSCRFETASTLAFASRALKLGKILPTVKVDEKIDDAVLLRQARTEIQRLKMAIANNDRDNNIDVLNDDGKSWEGKVRLATTAIHEVVDAVEAGKIKPEEVGAELKSFFSLSRRLQASVKTSFDDGACPLVSEESMQGGEDTSEKRQEACNPQNAFATTTKPLNTCREDARPINNTLSLDDVSACSLKESMGPQSPISLAEARHEELCSSFDDNDVASTATTPPKKPAHQSSTACDRHEIEDCFLCKIENSTNEKPNASRGAFRPKPNIAERKSRIRQRSAPSIEPRPRWTHRTDSYPARKSQEYYARQKRPSRLQSSIPKPTTRSQAKAKMHSPSLLKSPTQALQPKARTPKMATRRPTSSRSRIRSDEMKMKSAKDKARMAIAEASRILAHM